LRLMKVIDLTLWLVAEIQRFLNKLDLHFHFGFILVIKLYAT
jgi:hypothetical protein